ncbi:superinfection exclusion B family protein [Clostridium perfringens]
MNLNITENITSLLKLPNELMASITFATGLVLFLPESIINTLYMSAFKEKYGFIVGVVFIISFSILLISLITTSYKSLRRVYINKNFKKNSKKILMNLTLGEKAVVTVLYEKPNHTLELPINDGIINCLEQKLIITKTTTQYPVSDLTNPKFPYMLQPWVVEKLQNDQELLSLFENNLNENENEVKDILNEVFYKKYF